MTKFLDYVIAFLFLFAAVGAFVYSSLLVGVAFVIIFLLDLLMLSVIYRKDREDIFKNP